MNMPASFERRPGFWAHKARALLLPTPLAPLDSDGESERTRALLDWLGPASREHDDGFFDRCNLDARGVHVPGLLESSGSATTERKLELTPLLHPLTGMPPANQRSETLPLDELRRRYQQWIDHLLGNREPPGDARSFEALWRAWRCSPDDPRFAWLARLPGHSLLRDHSVFAHRAIASALTGARYEGGRPCLLCMHSGPVQSFISAARRTSDLWLGSYLVNLLCYQAVRSVAEYCGPDSLLYPDLTTLPLAVRDANPNVIREAELEDRQPWLRAAQPNRFVAIVDSGRARDIATRAAEAVHRRWVMMASNVARGVERCFEVGDGFAGFDQQIGQQLEIDIVIQPWPDTTEDLRAMLDDATCSGEHDRPCIGEHYPEVFRLGRRTLTAQRSVRTFVPAEGDARPKCTQCGRREQLGPGAGRRQSLWWKQLRESLRSGPRSNHDADKGTLEFRSGEALCAVCITKRLVHRFDLAGPQSEFGLRWDRADHRALLRFPSVATIASAPFRQRLTKHADHEAVCAWLDRLAVLDAKLDFEPPGNLLPGLGPSGRGSRILSYEGTWLYARSYEADTVVRDFDLERTDDDLEVDVRRAARAFARVREAVSEDGAESVSATPYYALIMADVDRMGDWLDGSHPRRPTLREVIAGSRGDTREAVDLDRKRPISSALHAEISARQGRLSSRTLHEVVEDQHLGRVVYSGGDDLLALVPLHRVWRCLADLERTFQADDALGPSISVSAGVAILDWRAPLSFALRLAHAAEARAKQSRGCVAVTVDVRSGAPIELDLSWALAGELPTVVESLKARDGEDGDPSIPPILRPSAAEQLRGELEILQNEGLEPAFRSRVCKLVAVDEQAPGWLDELLSQRKPGTMGQVVGVLLLLRFLARQRGGIAFARTTECEQ